MDKQCSQELADALKIDAERVKDIFINDIADKARTVLSNDNDIINLFMQAGEDTHRSINNPYPDEVSDQEVIPRETALEEKENTCDGSETVNVLYSLQNSINNNNNNNNNNIEGFTNNEIITGDKLVANLYGSIFNYEDNAEDINEICNSADVAQSVEDTLNREGSIFDDVKKTYNSYRSSYKNGLETYKTIYTYFDSIFAIKKETQNKLNRINNKIDTLEQNMNLDDRKDKYNYNNLNFYNKVYSWIFILYYTLFIVYLMFSDFFSTKKYMYPTYQFFIIIYILFPFILKYLLNYIYNAYIYILEMFYLKNDEISYQNILEESEHILNNYDNKIDRNEKIVSDLTRSNY